MRLAEPGWLRQSPVNWIWEPKKMPKQGGRTSDCCFVVVFFFLMHKTLPGNVSS